MIRAIFAFIMRKTQSPRFWVVLAIVLRMGYGLTKLDQPINDQDRYLPFAESLWHGEGLVYNGRPTAYRPPLYPIVLAPLVGLLGQGQLFYLSLVIIQAMMGGLMTWFAMIAAWRLPNCDSMGKSNSRKSTAAGLIAGFITACDPVLISQSSLPMTETLASLLVIWALALALSDRYFASGIVFGLSALCRPSLLACVVLVMLTRVWSSLGGHDLRKHIRQAVTLGIATFMILLPWGIRNWYVLGKPVFTTTHGGYTFALANNEVYYDEVLNGPSGAVWTGPRQQAWMDAIGPSLKGLSEPECDQEMNRRTWLFVSQHPSDFLRACMKRQQHFWAVMPSSQVYGQKIRVLSAIWTIPFWMLVITAGFKKSTWQWPALASVGVVFGLASVHLLYWTDLRMRAPIVPALAVLASESLVFLNNWRKCPNLKDDAY